MVNRMGNAKTMEPIKNELLEQAHSPQAWDVLFTQHSQAGTLTSLGQELIPYIADPVVAARYAACRYEEKNALDNAQDHLQSSIQTLEQITAFLKPFTHPLTLAYQVCWTIFTSEDQDAAILERFLGTVAAPKKPHQVLLRGRDVETVLDMEAVLRLDYALGLCLYRGGHIDQSKPFLESANDWAAVLGINQLLLVSQFDLGLFNALGGKYEDAERTFTQVISTGKKIDSKVAKRAVMGRIWNAFVSGISLKNIPFELLDNSMSRIVQQTMLVFQNNTFEISKKLQHHPAAQLLFSLDRGRNLGFALRHLELGHIEQCTTEMLELENPGQQDLFSYLITFVGQVLALCHCNRSEEALEWIRTKILHTERSKNEFSRLIAALCLTLCQLTLGDQICIPELKEVVPIIESYLRKHKPAQRRNIIEFGARAYTNVFALFAYGGLNIPELQDYIDTQCLVVYEDRAVYKGQVVEGYPVALGHSYHQMFNGDLSTNSPTVRKRLQRHREAIDALGLKEYPPIVYDASVRATLAHLIDNDAWPVTWSLEGK
jgi:hypothetical protein